MRADVAAALSKSAAAFRDLVWPAIAADLGGGELIPVESVTESGFKDELDKLAGVDAWQLIQEQGLRPLASRVQAGWGNPRTFTIRWSLRSGARTEIDKRIDAIRDGYLYPAITVQAYLDCPQQPHLDDGFIRGWDGCQCRSWSDHPFIAAAHIDTVVLYEFASTWRARHAHHDDLWRTRDGAYVKDVKGGNRMLVVRWDALPDTTIRLAA